MSNETQTKINQLMRHIPKGVVILSSWLENEGYSYELQHRYRESQWLQRIGRGAMIRSGDTVGYEGGVFALQEQAGLSVHPGAATALALLGKAHYLELNTKRVTLFGGRSDWLPAWFLNHDWGLEIDYYPTSFLPVEVGLTKTEMNSFSLKISDRIRAMMECLYLAPEKLDLVNCYELMEGLNDLRPDKVQFLLEQCTSVKVKRLFLFMAGKAGHQWFSYLNLNKIDMGKGKRMLVRDGVYIPKYEITIPRNLAQK